MNQTNNSATEQILSFLDKNPIALVGSGVSGAYFMNWADLVQELSKRVGLEVGNGLEPMDQAQQLHDYNKEKYYSALSDIFSEYPDDCSNSLRDIVTLDFRSFMTTNYDWSIQFAFRATKQEEPVPHFYPGLLEVDCHEMSIHHIHGVVKKEKPSESKLILHRDSYEEAYFKSNDLRGYLCSVFYHSPVLIIGYSMSPTEPINGVVDFALHKLGERKLKEQKKRENGIGLRSNRSPDHAILLENNFPADERERLAELGLRVVLYDPLDESYSGFDEVWREVAKAKIRRSITRTPEAINSYDAMPKPEWTGPDEL